MVHASYKIFHAAMSRENKDSSSVWSRIASRIMKFSVGDHIVNFASYLTCSAMYKLNTVTRRRETLLKKTPPNIEEETAITFIRQFLTTRFIVWELQCPMDDEIVLIKAKVVGLMPLKAQNETISLNNKFDTCFKRDRDLTKVRSSVTFEQNSNCV